MNMVADLQATLSCDGLDGQTGVTHESSALAQLQSPQSETLVRVSLQVTGNPLLDVVCLMEAGIKYLGVRVGEDFARRCYGVGVHGRERTCQQAHRERPTRDRVRDRRSWNTRSTA